MFSCVFKPSPSSSSPGPTSPSLHASFLFLPMSELQTACLLGGSSECQRRAVEPRIQKSGSGSELFESQQVVNHIPPQPQNKNKKLKVCYFLWPVSKTYCIRGPSFPDSAPPHPTPTPHQLARLNCSTKTLHRLSAVICAGPLGRVIVFTAEWLWDGSRALDPVQRQTADGVAVMSRPPPLPLPLLRWRRAHFHRGFHINLPPVACTAPPGSSAHLRSVSKPDTS